MAPVLDPGHVVRVHLQRAGARDVRHQPMSTGGPCGNAPPRGSSTAPWDSPAFLSRSDLASHLKLSLRSVDRFIARYWLHSGPKRTVLVRRESYAWCLVSLRRQSTRSLAVEPAVRSGARPPRPVQPGEELLLVASSEESEPLVEAVEMYTGCRVGTLDEYPAGHWSHSWHQAAKTMAGVFEAVARGASRPESAGDPSASRYLRQFLTMTPAGAGMALDAAVLGRCLRQLPAAERRLLFDALGEEVGDAARSRSPAPLAYAREPLLNEDELASEVQRTVATVRRWRVEGTGPVYLSIGRAVRYSRVDVDRWLGKRHLR